MTFQPLNNVKLPNGEPNLETNLDVDMTDHAQS